jgi:hypothetical protein
MVKFTTLRAERRAASKLAPGLMYAPGEELS